jgi:hypothetical protein
MYLIATFIVPGDNMRKFITLQTKLHKESLLVAYYRQCLIKCLGFSVVKSCS